MCVSETPIIGPRFFQSGTISTFLSYQTNIFFLIAAIQITNKKKYFFFDDEIKQLQNIAHFTVFY